MTTTTQDQDQCRAEFEAWANGILALAYECEKGRYVDGYSETCFQCWQAARRTQPSLKAQRDSERLDFMIEHRAYVVSDPDCCDGYWLNYARPDGTMWTQATEHETPRAAIDAAREKAK